MSTFQDTFYKVLKSDSAYVKPFMISWDYQIRRKNRKKSYGANKPENFYEFNSENEIVNWFNWFDDTQVIKIDNAFFDHYIDLSKKTDEIILNKLNVSYNFSKYQSIGSNNVVDFYFPKSNEFHLRDGIKNVLDFGSGYGRQANLWWASIEGKGNFISMDAIPLSYGLQNVYYHSLTAKFKDYIDNPTKFKIDLNQSGIYHIPTWRFDLVENNTLDLVICVQVLPEINSSLIKYITQQFHRTLKDGGLLYIRDTGSLFKTIGFNYDAHFLKNGFVLEHSPTLNLTEIPATQIRVYRKVTVAKNKPISLKQRLRFLLEEVDALIKRNK